MEETSRFGTQVKGVIGLVVIAMIVAGLIGVYQKTFIPVTKVTVISDRAGLQLDKGSSVRAFGVPVGEVRSVKVRGDGVAIEVALDKDKVKRIPADVTATIRATTVFGAKFVELDVPAGAIAKPISAGDVVHATATTVEANDLFQHAMSVLDAIQPEKLSSTLSAMATALDGNGEQLGSLVTGLDTYLTRLTPHINDLVADLQLVADVAKNLNAVAPQALNTVDQLNTTTDMFNEVQADFDQILKDIIPAADSVGGLIQSFDKPLTDAVDNLLKVSGTLNEYAPALPCTLQGLIDHVNILGKALGRARPSADADAGFLPGMEPYKKKNLPKLVTGVGPKCYAQGSAKLPHPPHVLFDDGTKDVYGNGINIVQPNTTPITLYQDSLRSFFGNSGLASFLQLLEPKKAGSAR